MIGTNKDKSKTFITKRESILSSFKKALDGLVTLNDNIDKRQEAISKEKELLIAEEKINQEVKDFNINSINTLNSILTPNKNK